MCSEVPPRKSMSKMSAPRITVATMPATISTNDPVTQMYCLPMKS